MQLIQALVINKKLVVIPLILIFLLVNKLPNLMDLLPGFDETDTFYFSNINGEYSSKEYREFKRGQHFETIVNYHKVYVHCHPSFPHKDKQLYRNFSMKPWQFWFWINYFVHPRWRLPYLAPDKILPKPKMPTPSICIDKYGNETVPLELQKSIFGLEDSGPILQK